jgi:hypothetical protein
MSEVVIMLAVASPLLVYCGMTVHGEFHDSSSVTERLHQKAENDKNWKGRERQQGREETWGKLVKGQLKKIVSKNRVNSY